MASIHVLLEGPDDERFFRSVLRPELAKAYDNVRTYLYAQKSKKEITKYVKTLNESKQRYIVLANFDAKDSCYGKRKIRLRRDMPRAGDSNIAIVKTEIESWYLAGMGRRECDLLQIPHRPNTEPVSKEEFEQMRGRAKPMPRAEFMVTMLDAFSADTAKRQNASFGYAWAKLFSVPPSGAP